MDTNILLESGTNELEVLEFTLGDNYYGINVAKIREILTYQQVILVINRQPSIYTNISTLYTNTTLIRSKNVSKKQ